MLPESTEFFEFPITLVQHGRHGWADWGAFLEAVDGKLELFHNTLYSPPWYKSVQATRTCQTAESRMHTDWNVAEKLSWCQWAAETLRAGTACKASYTRCAPELWQKIPAAVNLGSKLRIRAWNSSRCFSPLVFFPPLVWWFLSFGWMYLGWIAPLVNVWFFLLFKWCLPLLILVLLL